MPRWWIRLIESLRIDKVKFGVGSTIATITTVGSVLYALGISEERKARYLALKEDQHFEETLDISEEDMARLREQYPRLSDSELRRHHISMLKHYAALHKEVAAMEAAIVCNESLKVYRKNSFIRRSLDDQQ